MDIAKDVARFKRKILRRNFQATRTDGTIWTKIYNGELECIFVGLDLVSVIRINRLKWIDNVNRMDEDRVPKRSLNNQSEGNRLGGRPRNRCCNCVEADLKKCKTFD